MALKKKDGTTYRLRGPVPFMRDQNMFDDFILHNFSFSSIVLSDDGPALVATEGRLGFVEELTDLHRDDKHTPLPITPTSEQSDAEFLPPPEVVKKQETPTAASSVLKKSPNKVPVYCRPASVRVYADELYGETRRTIEYGEPFIFEGVVVYADDLSLTVWSPTETVTIGSTIFPQNRDKRWWKVSSRQPQMNGWLLQCSISDDQPRFRA